MEVSSFLTSLLTSMAIFLVLVLLFAWLSRMPCNHNVYFPALILSGQLDPGQGRRRRRNPFAWVREAAATPEREVVAAAGVDAAVHLLFLGTACKILALSGLLLLPLLLPLARTDTNIDNELKSTDLSKANLSFNELDKLTMANLQAKSPKLWAFLAGTYWVTFVTILFLCKAYKHASNLHASASSDDAEMKPESFAILVRDIPRVFDGETVKTQVDSYFRALYPDTFYRSMIVTSNREVEKIWKELEMCRKKLARAEAVFAESKTTERPEGKRPTHRVGLLGLVGEELDTINLCHGRINDLLVKLEEEQRYTHKDREQGAALVFFNSRQTVVSASQTLHSRRLDSWAVQEAPEPRQLLWRSLSKTILERTIRRWIVQAVVILTVVFYMVPIAFISAFTTLENLRRLMPFTKAVVDRPAAKTVLEAYLPQVALIVFLALLPGFLMFLSEAEGIPSRGNATRVASGKYFCFMVFNVFIGVSIGGTLFSSLKTVERQPGQIVAMLGSTLPGNASFFLTFVALRSFVGYGLELCRLAPLIMYHLKRKYLCRTEEELKEAWAPGDLQYATRVPNDMLVMTVVLCYSVISPLIIPFGIAYFGLGWLVMKNQALRVYVPSYESNGRMWPHIHKRIVAALLIFQLTMIGYFGVKKFYYTPLLLPLPILSLVLAYACHKRYYLAFVHTPLEVACPGMGDQRMPDMEAAYAAYIPACLSCEKLGMSDSDQYEDCRSHASRTPSVSLPV